MLLNFYDLIASHHSIPIVLVSLQSKHWELFFIVVWNSNSNESVGNIAHVIGKRIFQESSILWGKRVNETQNEGNRAYYKVPGDN